MQVCHHNPTAAFINCAERTHLQVVHLLLMFVTYCLEALSQEPPTIPIILSGLRHNFRARFIDDSAFDDTLLASMKKGVSRLPYTPRTRLPCTFDMVQHIVYMNTGEGFSHTQYVKAVAVSMAYYLCLRSSEYVSKTSNPHPESHQFDSQSVEFLIKGRLVPSHFMHNFQWKQIELVKFTLQHAKNIKKGYGVPIWFAVDGLEQDAVVFVQLVFLWAQMSRRQPDDPFLSHRTLAGRLVCLTYKTFQTTIKDCAVAFGFNPAWFNTHSVRMAAPTVLRAAGGTDREIMLLGRWKGVPTTLTYQGSSTANNNRMLQLLTNSSLFTSKDISLGRVLPPTKGTKGSTVRRF